MTTRKVFSLENASIDAILRSGLKALSKLKDSKLLEYSPVHSNKKNSRNDDFERFKKAEASSSPSRTSFFGNRSLFPFKRRETSTVRNMRLFYRLSVGEEMIKNLAPGLLNQCIGQVRMLPLGQLIQMRLVQPEMREVPDSLQDLARFLREIDHCIYSNIVDAAIENFEAYNSTVPLDDSSPSPKELLSKAFKFKGTNSQKRGLSKRAKKRLGREAIMILGLVTHLEEKMFQQCLALDPPISQAWWRVVAEVPATALLSVKNTPNVSISPFQRAYVQSTIESKRLPPLPRLLSGQQNDVGFNATAPPAVDGYIQPTLLRRGRMASYNNTIESADSSECRRERMAKGRRSMELARSNSVEATFKTLEEKTGTALLDAFICLPNMWLTTTRPDNVPVYICQNTEYVKYQTITIGNQSSSNLSCDIIQVDPLVPLTSFLRPSDATSAIRVELHEKVKLLGSTDSDISKENTFPFVTGAESSQSFLEEHTDHSDEEYQKNVEKNEITPEAKQEEPLLVVPKNTNAESSTTTKKTPLSRLPTPPKSCSFQESLDSWRSKASSVQPLYRPVLPDVVASQKNQFYELHRNNDRSRLDQRSASAVRQGIQKTENVFTVAAKASLRSSSFAQNRTGGHGNRPPLQHTDSTRGRPILKQAATLMPSESYDENNPRNQIHRTLSHENIIAEMSSRAESLKRQPSVISLRQRSKDRESCSLQRNKSNISSSSKVPPSALRKPPVPKVTPPVISEPQPEDLDFQEPLTPDILLPTIGGDALPHNADNTAATDNTDRDSVIADAEVSNSRDNIETLDKHSGQEQQQPQLTSSEKKKTKPRAHVQFESAVVDVCLSREPLHVISSKPNIPSFPKPMQTNHSGHSGSRSGAHAHHHHRSHRSLNQDICGPSLKDATPADSRNPLRWANGARSLVNSVFKPN